MSKEQGSNLPYARQCHGRKNILSLQGVTQPATKVPTTYKIADAHSMDRFTGLVTVRVDRVSDTGAWKIDFYTSMDGKEIQTAAPAFSFEGTTDGIYETYYTPETFYLIPHITAVGGELDVYVTIS